MMVTVAAVGAEVTKEQQPNLPVTPEEVGVDAVACAEAGASIYHLHVRDDDGRPTMEVERFRAAHEAITESTDLIVQFTSGGAVGDDQDHRKAPLDLRPEMATLTTGTVNFGDEVFMNPAPLVRELYSKMRSLGVVPEFEIFDTGMIEGAERVYRDEGGDHHRHYDLVLGVPGGMPAWPDSLEYLVGHLPPDATWSATGIGRAHPDIAERAVGLGGHLRTGFEDVLYIGRGERARSNAQLVERAVALGRAAGRDIATPAVARSILGL